MGENEDGTALRFLRPSAVPSPFSGCLCVQRAGTLCCCGCLERPKHFVDGVIEDVPAAVVLLRALFHPANSALPGDTPTGIMRPLHRIPPPNTTAYPNDTPHFVSVSSSSFHGVE